MKRRALGQQESDTAHRARSEGVPTRLLGCERSPICFFRSRQRLDHFGFHHEIPSDAVDRDSVAALFVTQRLGSRSGRPLADE